MCDEKAKGHNARESSFLHFLYSSLQQRNICFATAGRRRNGTLRETAITPAQREAEVAPSQRFICAKLKLSRGAGCGVYDVAGKEKALQIRSRRWCNRILTGLPALLTTSFPRIAKYGILIFNFISSKSNFTVQKPPQIRRRIGRIKCPCKP